MVKLTEAQKAELEALEKLSDDKIDFSDIPERPIDWSKAKIGMHYKPDWQDITLRLDQNVIDWFEEQVHPRKPTRISIRSLWSTSGG